MKLTQEVTEDKANFNSEEALKHFEGDTKALMAVIEVFINDMPEKDIRIKDAFIQKDFDAISKIAHSIKGGALYAGAEKIHSMAILIENAAQSKDFEKASSHYLLLQKIFVTYTKETKRFIESYNV